MQFQLKYYGVQFVKFKIFDGISFKFNISHAMKRSKDTNSNLKRLKSNQSNVSPYFQTERLSDDFFDVSCFDLAKNLLGTVLVRKLENGTILKAKIVETECYPGNDDKASHSYNGRRTPKSEPMYMKPGTIYVYKTYGMYHCFNISSRGKKLRMYCFNFQVHILVDQFVFVIFFLN